jgi:hypothetical protein
VFGFLESNNPLPDRKLARDNWEAFVLDIAAGKIDREETTTRLRNLLKWRRRWTAKR